MIQNREKYDAALREQIMTAEDADRFVGGYITHLFETLIRKCFKRFSFLSFFFFFPVLSQPLVKSARASAFCP